MFNPNISNTSCSNIYTKRPAAYSNILQLPTPLLCCWPGGHARNASSSSSTPHRFGAHRLPEHRLPRRALRPGGGAGGRALANVVVAVGQVGPLASVSGQLVGGGSGSGEVKVPEWYKASLKIKKFTSMQAKKGGIGIGCQVVSQQD